MLKILLLNCIKKTSRCKREVFFIIKISYKLSVKEIYGLVLVKVAPL